MQTAAFATSHGSHATGSSSTKAVWLGRILSALPLLFLTIDTAIKVLQMPVALEATQQLGFTASAVVTIGVIEAVCLVLYLVPRTAVVGAVLWTGYFGGAIATHINAGSPLLTHTLVPFYLTILLWAGLWLRDGRLRRIVAAACEPASA